MKNICFTSTLAGLFLFCSALLPIRMDAHDATGIAKKSTTNKSATNKSTTKKSGSKKLTAKKSGSKKSFRKKSSSPAAAYNFSVNAAFKADILIEADSVYEQMALAEKGLSKKAFTYAWKGYRILQMKGYLLRSDVLTICDFSQSSRDKRLYIIDVEKKELLVNTFVAHGKNSGAEFAQRFSNRSQSRQSSLGFYVTRQTYLGENGLSLRMDGMEQGFNDRANARNIVVHGSGYIGEQFMENNPFNGRSYGCPAVPGAESKFIIESIKDGSCLFIYHPSSKYVKKSRILNA